MWTFPSTAMCTRFIRCGNHTFCFPRSPTASNRCHGTSEDPALAGDQPKAAHLTNRHSSWPKNTVTALPASRCRPEIVSLVPPDTGPFSGRTRLKLGVWRDERERRYFRTDGARCSVMRTLWRACFSIPVLHGEITHHCNRNVLFGADALGARLFRRRTCQASLRSCPFTVISCIRV